MAKRVKVGLIYSYDENWIGGTYYYQYLIRSLNLLSEEEKPHLCILSNDEKSFDSVKKIKYTYITYHLLSTKPNSITKIKKLVYRKLKRPYKAVEKKINLGIDVLFHPSEIEIPNTIDKHLYWIPDFQEYYLPQFFSEKYLKFRSATQQKLLGKDIDILFSSEDAKNDFKKIYPLANSTTHVVNFAVFHQEFNTLKLDDLKEKFQFDKNIYFFCPNQFWMHKNQLIVLKAIKEIKESSDIQPFVLFTGKEFDSRNPTYFEDLQTYVRHNNIEENVKFLGFIDRKEQLCLMKNAIAVIQPSLFEGWSSVVEDGKAMNQNLIVSSLNVHKEQLGDKAHYFDPKKEKELSNLIQKFTLSIQTKPQFEYENAQTKFGEKFMDVIKKIV